MPKDSYYYFLLEKGILNIITLAYLYPMLAILIKNY